MNALVLLFTLAAIGSSEATYLIRKRLVHNVPVCPLGEPCAVVFESKYNHVFGVPNDIAGGLFYVVTAALTALFVIGVGPALWWTWIFRAALAVAFIMSLIFVFIQWRVPRAWCFWCLISAGTVFATALIAF